MSSSPLTRSVLAAAVLATGLLGCGEPQSPVELPAAVAPLSTNTAKATRTIAAMQFDISMGPPNMTTIQNLLVGSGQSLRRMYNEISFGIQDITVDMLGPYTLPMPQCLPIECCGPKTTQPNGPAVMQIIAGLPKTYNHYFWVYGANNGLTGCSTWGDEGRASMPAVYSSYNFHSIVGYSQELGHNFGMTHEPTITCTGNVPLLDDTTQCTHHEYGSQLSFMGGGAHHPSAYHKFQEGWIGNCNVVRAGASARFTLVPQELPCDGVQLLQIPAPKTRPAPAANDRQGRAPNLINYYAELRAPYGFDTGLGPMVVLSIGDALPTAQQNGSPYLYVIDLTPEANRANLNNAGLMTAGQSFMDPAGGMTITLVSIDNRSATIDVQMTGGSGNNTCADGTTAFTAPGPDGTSCQPVVGSDGGLPPPTEAGTPPPPSDAGARDAGAVADAGRTATGGTTGTTGAGGTGPAGTGGRGGSSGGGASDAAGPPGETAVGGCGCAVAAEAPGAGLALFVLSVGAALVVARRRRRGDRIS